MKRINRRTAIKISAAGVGALALRPGEVPAQDAQPFGAEFPNLESLTTGQWWTKSKAKPKPKRGGATQAPSMDVPREEVVAFAVYTYHGSVLKISAQLFPLRPHEERVARLEFQRGGRWSEAARADVHYPGWDAHFRIENWDNSQNVPYRVRHGEKAVFEGDENPVVQVIEEETGEILYTIRAPGGRFQPRVYSKGKHTVKIGRDKPDARTLAGLESKPKSEAGRQTVKL